MPEEIMIKEGWMFGPWRKAINDFTPETRPGGNTGWTYRGPRDPFSGTPEEKSYLQKLEPENSPQEELRILKGVKAGDEMTPFEDILDSLALENWLVYLEDKIEWYSKKSPWGPPIAPISRVVNFMQVPLPFLPQAVGFFGGTEIRFFNGPIKNDTLYRAKGKIIAVGITGKTEYYWYESQLYERRSDRLIAGMRHMTRFMKAGSPLYPEIN